MSNFATAATARDAALAKGKVAKDFQLTRPVHWRQSRMDHHLQHARAARATQETTGSPLLYTRAKQWTLITQSERQH